MPPRLQIAGVGRLRGRHNMLLRGVVRALTDEGFISDVLAAPTA